LYYFVFLFFDLFGFLLFALGLILSFCFAFFTSLCTDSFLSSFFDDETICLFTVNSLVALRLGENRGERLARAIYEAIDNYNQEQMLKKNLKI